MPVGTWGRCFVNSSVLEEVGDMGHCAPGHHHPPGPQVCLSLIRVGGFVSGSLR